PRPPASGAPIAPRFSDCSKLRAVWKFWRQKLREMARARTKLVAAQGEAKAQEQLATAYQDNRAGLGYELARRSLEVGTTLAGSAPRPVVVHTDAASGAHPALSTLLPAQSLPQIGAEGGPPGTATGGERRSVAEQAAQSAEDMIQQATMGADAGAHQPQQPWQQPPQQ